MLINSAIHTAFSAFAIAFGVVAFALPVDAFAQPAADSPVLLEADSFSYDTKNATVTAKGHAEVLQDDYIVLADEIIYDQNTGVVRAAGNVTVAEPTGNVYFAEEAELENEVKTGVIHNFRARLADNSLFVAREARKIDDHTTEMDYAVYSACKVCQDDPDSAPLWQLKASKIRYDEAEQRIVYRNARMEAFGVPVLYTPYFSHASPDADRKSGLLIPNYELSGNLGATLHLPFYVNLAPQMDAIVTPIYTSDEGHVLAGEFRHLTEKGYYELGGSITRPDRIDSNGTRNGDQEWRGHVEGTGRFGLSENWMWGFDAKRASDDTYLRRYEFGYEDLLTSRAFVQGYKNRSFANVEAVSFQGLRVDDNSEVIPLIHPLVNMRHETAPGWQGSRFGVEGNMLALSRDTGSDTQRLSSSVYWRAPMITKGGHVMELRTQLRADVYSVSDLATTTTGAAADNFDGTVGRVVPELWFDWKYPLIKRFESSSLTIEPTVNVVVGANNLNSDIIPNNDSLALEFSDSNLFSHNHYPGYDLVENGTRVNYGIRGQWDYDTDGRILFLFGQNYHTDDDNLFPYSNNLGDGQSDYVGRVAWDYSNNIQLAYRFRLDSENADLIRSEVESRFYLDPLRLNLNYVRVESDPYLEDSEEIRGSTRLQINDQWAWTTLGRRDLSENGGMIRAGTGLEFRNECVTIATSVNRYYIRDRDVEPSTSIKLQVFLKNLNQ
ncbi:MAG: LPS assembly protein LptD [Alphaproteobacteria bacterium]|nr:LPS assembly protein LptD [Alphaproteobacteria bacterium]